jgi:UDP-N-acetylglucosamine 2-epimerase (non-hydrolysing)
MCTITTIQRIINMKISIIIGTRPEIIKMSPLIRECKKRKLNYFVLHTGQHYSYNLDKIFFKDFDLAGADYNLRIGSGTHAEETGKMIMGIEKILLKEKPNTVLVQGDTNTVLAGALAALKLHMKIGHVESGLRSYDRDMPEEINRILADHISDYLFAPTELARLNLIKEGLDKERISVTGNTIVDSVFQNLKIARSKSNILELLGLSPRNYFLITAHRQENVDNKEKLKGILEGLELVSQKYNLPILYPIHPRTRKMLEHFTLEVPEDVRLIEPLGFLDFLLIEANSRLIFTDSGGLQEESCILGVPCVTLRNNTERPETLEVGSNVLAGTDKERILEISDMMLSKDGNWTNPFGDGKAAERIIDKIISS